MVGSKTGILGYFTNRIKEAKEKQLTELDLSVPWRTHDNDKLKCIPKEVFELTKLKKLSLGNNRIKEVPENITKLTNLRRLDLWANSISEIPESITKLVGLTHLDLSANGISEIPESISRLTKLRRLDLWGNDISEIPESVNRLNNLKQLYLSKNKISEIPESITQLTDLKQLDLSRNGLSEIPENITKIPKLTGLYLWGNNISEIPENITRIPKLNELNLSGNGISEIPESITQLTDLTELNLSKNCISEIPEGITKLTKLEKLNLSENSISEIPESITKLTNLTQLDLSGNGISTIPETIIKLTNLTQLALWGNDISTSLETITQLTNLTKLNLSGNGISTIPETITKLTNLTQLDLSKNGISEIPAYISKLMELTQLYLWGNSIYEIPECISKLSELTKLNLSGNSISEIPEYIGKLSKLTQLDLSGNSISEIPEAINKLTNLTELNLNSNRIKKVPSSINKLNNLIRLNLDNYGIETPPLEIIDKGIKSIRDYFLQLDQGQDYIYEAKLIIVGEAGAGKTTLAKKINNPDYKLKQDEQSTKGIDVLSWQFELPEKNREFKVNIWDFGGQEIYHATHQFFLTKRSLYALVADTRKENTDFYYWMNVVELLTDNSPILIIKNEKQDRHREIDERRLRGEFTNLKETLATNLKTNRGLDEILFNIKQYIQKLPHVGNALPKTWVDVRKTLEELKEQETNYINLDTYLNICEKNGFDKYENALQLSQYLHDLGVCLHFQDDPVLCKTVILKPEWGTDAVYKVLDNNTVVRNLGHFSKQDLANIWSDAKYQRMHNELLQLMIKFKLCYEIPNNQGNYIAPQLLSLTQPEYKLDSSQNLLLRYSYEFMPKGILTRFIVEMHKNIYQENVWRTGVVLAKDYAQAEVIEDYEKKEIEIRIDGNNKRDMMTIITNEIDNINDSYERIKYTKLIPCNCPTCNNKKEPHFYRLEKLLERLANDRCNVECGDPPYHEVSIIDLIDETVGKQNIDKENQRIVKIQAKHIDKLVLGQGDMDNRDRNFQVGDVGGDFNPTNSPIMSDNANISTASDYETPQKKRNWGLIIGIVGIIVAVCVSGLFNEEIREFFNLNSPSETPEQLENTTN